MKQYSYKLDDSTEAVALIAETLRKSYKYIEQTPVQEYLSNARDIHREFKIKKAIDVQVPTELNPEFFIRDYGSGLSEEQIVDYITFAKSTKRKNNTLTGGFGYGSKSFFAYADSFTIISYFNGIKYIYRASCVQNKEGALVLLRATETKEPNGLQVQVAVRPQDRKAFINAVLRLKQHWDDQEINIINLNPSEIIYGKKLIDSINSVKVFQEVERNQNYRYNSDNRSIFLLIDGIPYSVDNLRFNNKKVNNFINSIQSEYQIAFEFNTGDIAVSKYREYIEATPENISFIETFIESKIDKIKEHFAKELPVISNISDLKNLDVSKLFVVSQEISLKSSNPNFKIKVSQGSYYGSSKSGCAVSIELNESIKFPMTKTYTMNSNDAMTNSLVVFKESYYTKVKAGELTLHQEESKSSAISKVDFYCGSTTKIDLIVNDCEKVSVIDQSLRIKNHLKTNSDIKTTVVFSSENNSKNFLDFCKFFNHKNLSTIEKLVVVRQKRDSSSPTVSNVNKHNFTSAYVELTSNHDFKVKRKSEKGSFNQNTKFKNKTLIVPTQSNAFAKNVEETVLIWAHFCGYDLVLANKENCELLLKKANTVSYDDFFKNPKYSKKEEQKIIDFHQILLMLEFKQKNHIVSDLYSFIEHLPAAFNTKDLALLTKAISFIDRTKYSHSSMDYIEKEMVDYPQFKVNSFKNKAKEQFKQIVSTFNKFSFVSVLESHSSYDIKEKKDIYVSIFKAMSK